MFSRELLSIINQYARDVSNVKENDGRVNNEFEIRFGKNHYDHQSKSNRFESAVDIQFFYDLKRDLTAQDFVQTDKVCTIVSMYNNGIRKEVQTDENFENPKKIILTKKTQIKKYDVYDFDMRLSLCREQILNEADLDEETKAELVGPPRLMRYKSRVSFVLPLGTIDLTIVKTVGEGGVQPVMTHEVELEVKKHNEEYLKSLLSVMLQIRQSNYFVIPNSEKRRVLSEYRNIIGSNYFVGAQAETLQKSSLSKLSKEQYAVTDKADGRRMVMFITSTGAIYLLDDNLNGVIKTNCCSTQHPGCLIDGEYTIVNSEMHFLAFDILVFNGKDLRGNNQYDLRHRLYLASTVIQSVKCDEGSCYYKFGVKRFIFGNVFLGAEVIMNHEIGIKGYANDGLIFTPASEPYPKTRKWTGLLKWKPAHQNTIDFYAVKEEGGTWKLYVQGPQDTTNNAGSATKSNETSYVLFDINKLIGTNHSETTYMTTFDESLLDPCSNEPFVSHTVIEFKWDNVDKKFVPLRTRWDKTSNKRKHGNFSVVATNIWNAIHNPITPDLLFKNNRTTQDSGDPYFERMRKFHNRVKDRLYDEHVQDCPSLLELCSGRGGDLHKWIRNNVKKVVGYDISDRNIKECLRRVKEMKVKNVDYKFAKLDLSSRGAASFIKRSNNSKFNVASCQFGYHYFNQSDEILSNFIDILDANLELDGTFMATFMDDTCLNELMGNNESQTTIYKEHPQSNEIMYFLQKRQDNKLRVVLNGSNILGEGSDEFIVNFDKTVKVLEERGFELIQTELFKDVAEKILRNKVDGLNEWERDISFLNRYCVFKKVRESGIMTPKLTTKVAPNNNVPLTIELHRDGMTAHKISTSYDIIDVYNCIEVKHYKNNFENNQIVTFEDIRETFSQLEIFDTTPIECHNDIVVSEGWTGVAECLKNVTTKKVMVFVYNLHVIQKKGEDDCIQNIKFDNWYILMKDHQFIMEGGVQHKVEEGGSGLVVLGDRCESVEAANTTEEAGVVGGTAGGIIDEILGRPKVTIKELKECLTSLGLKVSGSKDALISRLKAYKNTAWDIV